MVPQPFGPGDWAQYWPVDMSFYQSKKLPKGKACPRGQSRGIVFVYSSVVGQNKSFTVAIGPLTLEGPKGTKLVDNFSYWNQTIKVRGARGVRGLLRILVAQISRGSRSSVVRSQVTVWR